MISSKRNSGWSVNILSNFTLFILISSRLFWVTCKYFFRFLIYCWWARGYSERPLSIFWVFIIYHHLYWLEHSCALWKSLSLLYFVVLGSIIVDYWSFFYTPFLSYIYYGIYCYLVYKRIAYIIFYLSEPSRRMILSG